MNINFKIRKGKIKDLEIIVDNNIKMAEETEGKRLDYSTVRNGVENALKDPEKGEYYVVEKNGKIIGQLMITKEWSDWRNCYFLWIQSVYTLPEFRGKGIFSSLFKYIEQIAKENFCCGLRLYVDRHNKKALDVYKRLGMVVSDYLFIEKEF